MSDVAQQESDFDKLCREFAGHTHDGEYEVDCLVCKGIQNILAGDNHVRDIKYDMTIKYMDIALIPEDLQSVPF